MEARKEVGEGRAVVEGDTPGCEEAQEVDGDGNVVGVETSRSTSGILVTRTGKVEGLAVNDVILDTGCARTMVCKDLVPEHKKVAGEAIRLRCAHGDIITYPVADLNLEVSGRTVRARAAVADKLPVSVLLGTDLPELGSLLCINTANAEEGAEDALVTTRAQAAAAAQAEIEEQRKQEHSGAQPHRLETRGEMEPIPAEGQQGSPFDTLDLFNIPATKTPLTRREKRRVRHEHGLVRAKDRPQLQPSKDLSLELDKEKIKQLQESDSTLDQVRELSEDPEQPFFVKDGLLYRMWEPCAWQGQDASEAVFQLILPKDCRPLALKLAHSVPLSGHLGRKKTMARLSRRFYWPSMHKDVASFCQCCETCQRFCKRKPSQGPTDSTSGGGRTLL